MIGASTETYEHRTCLTSKRSPEPSANPNQSNPGASVVNLPITGTGFISSLETGYPIPVPWLGPGFVLEPEAQIQRAARPAR